MALVVEDGSGVSGADSYQTLDGAKQYWDAHGLPYADKTDEQLEQSLRRGTAAIDASYGQRFSGIPAGGYMQALAWPRAGATTSYGAAVPSDVVPAPVVAAATEAAYLELAKPGSLAPVVTGSGMAKRKKVGQLEIEYAMSSATSVDELVAFATPVVTAIEGLLRQFFRAVVPGVMVV